MLLIRNLDSLAVCFNDVVSVQLFVIVVGISLGDGLDD